jgi:hypothetical protein
MRRVLIHALKVEVGWFFQQHLIFNINIACFFNYVKIKYIISEDKNGTIKYLVIVSIELSYGIGSYLMDSGFILIFKSFNSFGSILYIFILERGFLILYFANLSNNCLIDYKLSY